MPCAAAVFSIFLGRCLLNGGASKRWCPRLHNLTMAARYISFCLLCSRRPARRARPFSAASFASTWFCSCMPIADWTVAPWSSRHVPSRSRPYQRAGGFSASDRSADNATRAPFSLSGADFRHTLGFDLRTSLHAAIRGDHAQAAAGRKQRELHAALLQYPRLQLCMPRAQQVERPDLVMFFCRR
jgi:hypothetical protein